MGDNGSPYGKVNRGDFLNQNTYRRDGRLPGKREQPGLGFSAWPPSRALGLHSDCPRLGP